MLTQSQFYQKYKGKYIKVGGGTASSVDWDGVNGWAGQCATLAREYLRQCYGYANRSYGDGWEYVKIPKGKILSKPENWCLIVWPKQPGLPWGHVAVYYNGKMISQNPDKCNLITIWSGKKYYVRPYQYNVAPKSDYKNFDAKKYNYVNSFKHKNGHTYYIGYLYGEVLKSSVQNLLIATVKSDRIFYYKYDPKSKRLTQPSGTIKKGEAISFKWHHNPKK